MATRALIFEDARSRELLREIRQIAPSEATVLVTGETGTGKEIVARYVHELSRRNAEPFVSVNCGALSSDLADAELFGYERGAFTGATNAKPGWFEAAHGGTLFLDEIGDLQLSLQVKLLRVLQERQVVRLGSREPISIDVRLIAATNVDLAAAVRSGRFREDLFFRLHVASLSVPALRDRPNDILPLTEHFLRTHGQRCGIDEVSLTDDAVQTLLDYAWPGNIRELDNLIHRAVLTCRAGIIDAGDIALQATSEPTRTPDLSDEDGAFELLRASLHELFERGGPDLFARIDTAVVMKAYQFCHRNQVQAARLLGVTRNVLRGRLASLGVINGRRSRPEDRQALELPAGARQVPEAPNPSPRSYHHESHPTNLRSLGNDR
jgi:sigma-54-specific transcriptional regulator